jgi:hypothetical protein
VSEERKEQILDALVAELKRQAGEARAAAPSLSDGGGARRYRVNGEVDAIALATAIDAALGGDALEADPAPVRTAPATGAGSSPRGAYARADEGKTPEDLNASNDE